jgi:hypothetical protein
MKKLKIILPFIITSITLVIIYFTIYENVQLLGGLRTQYDNKYILNKAELFVKKYNLQTGNLSKYCGLESNQDLIRQIQNRFGYKKGNELLRTSLPGFFWKVTWSKVSNSNMSFGNSEGQSQSDTTMFRLEYDTHGNLMEFYSAGNDTEQIPQTGLVESGDVVRKFITHLFKIDNNRFVSNPSDTNQVINFSLISPYNEVFHFNGEKRSMISHKAGYVYSWRGMSAYLDDSIDVDVSVLGNNISAYNLSYIVPEKDAAIDPDTFHEVIGVVFYLIVIILIGIVVYRKIKAYEIGFKLAFVIALTVTISLGVNLYLISNGQVGWHIIFSLALGSVFYGGLVFIVWSAGETVTREVWNNKFNSVDLISKGYFFNVRIGETILNGLTAGFVLILVQIFSLFIVQSCSAISCTSYYDILLKSLNSLSPSITIFTKGIFYPVLLEAVFLLFIVSELRKRIKSSSVLIILTGTIWGLINSGDIYPYLVSTLINILTGIAIVFIFYKYDVLTSFISISIFFILFEVLALPFVGPAKYSSSANYLIFVIILFALYGIMALVKGNTTVETDIITPAFVKNITERERLQRELEIAKEVQMSFLPRTDPKFPGLEIASRCVPALEVGGDYYDFVVSGDKKIGIIIGDVSGKGTQAAFYMTLTKGFLKALTRIAYTPANFLTELNSLFYENVERGTFISMVYGVIDLENKNIKIARAGHNPVIVKNSLKGFTEFLNSSGMALGLEKGHIFNRSIKEVEVPFSSGDIFVFYTDGFTEAMNKLNEEFGEKRLVSSVENNSMLHADQILDNILKDVHKFIGKADQHDDMTMVIVKVI